MDKLPFKHGYVFDTTFLYWEKYDLIIHQGGTSSGKTYEILLSLLCKAIEKPRIITIVGQDLPNLKSGPIRDCKTIVRNTPFFEQYIEAYNLSENFYSFKNGSIIEFKSFKDDQDAKSGKRDILFCNEVNGIPETVFDELFVRTSEKTIVDYNPTAKFWLHNRIGNDNVIRIISNFTHNVGLDPRVRKKILSYRHKNPMRWQVYGLGKTGQTEGIIYPNVEFIGVKDFPIVQDMEKYGYGLDYGYSNDPLAFVEAGIYKGDIYARGLIYNTGLGINDILKRFELLEVDHYDLISMDDSQAKEQADVLRNNGYNVISANRKGGSILSGIGLLQDYKIYIVDDEKNNFQTEQENYKWAVIKGETSAKPVDKFNHYLDALRYWALEFMTEPEYEELDLYSGII